MIAMLIIGLFVGFNIPQTKLHQECARGNVDACKVEKKINPYVN